MRRLVVLPEVGSTNSWLKQQADFHRPFCGVRAVRQTQGRGRLTRSWHSDAAGEDLTCSFVLPIDPAARHMAPLVTALVLYRVVKRYADVRIKWPNDLLFHGKKLAGILCESIPEVDNLIIAGIGLNINSLEFPTEISEKTQSLALATGQKYSVQRIWFEIFRELTRVFRHAVFPLPAAFIAAYNAVAYRYVSRDEVSALPLEFKTLLPDGRAVFATAEGSEIILDMAG